MTELATLIKQTLHAASGFYGELSPDDCEKIAAAIIAAGWVKSGPRLTQPRVNGRPFRCICGSNVFRNSEPSSMYECNACGEVYEGLGIPR